MASKSQVLEKLNAELKENVKQGNIFIDKNRRWYTTLNTSIDGILSTNEIIFDGHKVPHKTIAYLPDEMVKDRQHEIQEACGDCLIDMAKGLIYLYGFRPSPRSKNGRELMRFHMTHHFAKFFEVMPDDVLEEWFFLIENRIFKTRIQFNGYFAFVKIVTRYKAGEAVLQLSYKDRDVRRVMTFTFHDGLLNYSSKTYSD